MKLSTMFTSIFVMGTMLCTGYKQNMYTVCELYSNNNVNIVEKSIKKDIKYLKEDLKIPQLAEGKDLNKLSEINSKINNDILPKLNEAEKTAEEYYGGLNTESPKFPFEVYSRYKVTQNNNSIISLYNDYYEFLGGAHGVTTRTSYTVDKDQEKMLYLSDLFVSGYDYKSVINDEIKKQIGDNPQKYFESADKFKGIADNQGFYIDSDSIVIYYQEYELAPYAGGIPEFNISIDKFGSSYKYITPKV